MHAEGYIGIMGWFFPNIVHWLKTICKIRKFLAKFKFLWRKFLREVSLYLRQWNSQVYTCIHKYTSINKHTHTITSLMSTWGISGLHRWGARLIGRARSRTCPAQSESSVQTEVRLLELGNRNRTTDRNLNCRKNTHTHTSSESHSSIFFSRIHSDILCSAEILWTGIDY